MQGLFRAFVLGWKMGSATRVPPSAIFFNEGTIYGNVSERKLLGRINPRRQRGSSTSKLPQFLGGEKNKT